MDFNVLSNAEGRLRANTENHRDDQTSRSSGSEVVVGLECSRLSILLQAMSDEAKQPLTLHISESPDLTVNDWLLFLALSQTMRADVCEWD